MITGNANLAAAAFTADGQTLISGSQDGTVAVSPLRSSAMTTALTYATYEFPSFGYASEYYAVSPDGRIVAAANLYGGVSLWNITQPAQPRQVGQIKITGNDFSVDLVTFSPGGRTLAIGVTTGDGNGTVTLWDVTNPARPDQIGRPLSDDAFGGSTGAATFSPDGRVLAIGNADGSVTLWNVTDPARPQPLNDDGPLLSDDSNPFDSLEFSPDGRLLVGVLGDGTIAIWELTGSSYPQPMGLPLTTDSGEFAVAAAFGPRGRTLAIGAGNSNGAITITLWNLSNPADPRQMGGPLTEEGASLATSPDGQTLAAGSTNGTVTLWDITDPAHPRQIGQNLSTDGGTMSSAAFGAQGIILATTTYDDTIQVWDLDINYAIKNICGTTALTAQQWRQYLPQLPYQPPCPR